MEKELSAKEFKKLDEQRKICRMLKTKTRFMQDFAYFTLIDPYKGEKTVSEWMQTKWPGGVETYTDCDKEGEELTSFVYVELYKTAIIQDIIGLLNSDASELIEDMRNRHFSEYTVKSKDMKMGERHDKKTKRDNTIF
jgi:hypothetical protein